MAASPSQSPSSFFLMVPFFLLLTFTSSTSNFPSSSSSISVASGQRKFWSKNVLNNMPDAILSKLSPLSVHDSDYFTSLLSKQSFISTPNFCSLSNLACAATLDKIRQQALAYEIPQQAKTYEIPQQAKIYEIPQQAKIYMSNNNKHITASHLAEVDPFSFFRLSALKEGKRVRLPDLRDTYPSRAFLPSQIASKISLSSSELKKVFPESFVSPVTNGAIEMTLGYCHAPNQNGEIKSCPKSLEEMIHFSKNALAQKRVLALTSKRTEGSGKELIVGNIKQYDTKKVVSCHEVFLPFATYFCHLISSTSHLYAVDLVEPETRIPVNTALAACHFDTSAWPANHVAFKLLKMSPGKGEVCHWFSQADLAWVGA